MKVSKKSSLDDILSAAKGKGLVLRTFYFNDSSQRFHAAFSIPGDWALTFASHKNPNTAMFAAMEAEAARRAEGKRSKRA